MTVHVTFREATSSATSVKQLISFQQQNSYNNVDSKIQNSLHFGPSCLPLGVGIYQKLLYQNDDHSIYGAI